MTCGVVDDKGQQRLGDDQRQRDCTATAATTCRLRLASSLCSVSFERDAKRPTRVDNEAKACLDDVALGLQRSSDAKLALVGNEDAKEQKVDDRGWRR